MIPSKSILPHPILSHLAQSPLVTTNSPIPALANDFHGTRGSCFSPCNPRTEFGEAPSLSDGLTPTSCLTPGSDSSLDSHLSNDHPVKSLDSSRYLTPPEDELGLGLPPHKPRSRNSDSLTMIHPAKTSTRYRARRQSRARRRRSQNCELHREQIREQERRPYWWLPGRKVTPHAPQGSRDGTETWVDYETTLRKSGQADIDGRVDFQRLLLSLPAPPVLSQRRSSIGTRRPFPCEDFGHRQKGKTWPDRIRQDSVIKVIRKKLTNRKISAVAQETPASITLKRASLIPSYRQGMILSTVKHTRSINKSSQKDENTPVAEGETTYLITSQDVESITQLIRSSMPSNSEEPSRLAPRMSELESMPVPEPGRFSVNTIRQLGLTKHGFQPRSSLLADVATTILEGIPTQHMSSELFSVAPDSHRESTVTKVVSKKSIHEIIWEDGWQTSSTSSSTTVPSERTSSSVLPHAAGRQSSTTRPQNYISQCSIPQSMTSRTMVMDKKVCEEDIISNQAFRWQLMKPSSQDESQPPFPPFDRDFSLSTPTKSNDSCDSDSAILSTKVDEVISFPALPHRKSTIDWISSPPDIASIMETLPISQTRPDAFPMYSHGIDAVGRLSDSQPSVQSASVTPGTEIGAQGFSFGYVKGNLSTPSSRQSTATQHSSVSARAGEIRKSCSAVGSSSGLRRKSSTRPTRIRFEYRNDEEILDDRKPWKKPRKDSEYPLKRCHSTSPEDEASRRDSIAAGIHRRESRSCELLASTDGLDKMSGERWKDRDRVIAESSPQLMVKDWAGIYVTLTGAEEGTGGEDGERGFGSENGTMRRDFAHVHDANAFRNPSVDWIG